MQQCLQCKVSMFITKPLILLQIALSLFLFITDISVSNDSVYHSTGLKAGVHPIWEASPLQGRRDDNLKHQLEYRDREHKLQTQCRGRIVRQQYIYIYS